MNCGTINDTVGYEELPRHAPWQTTPADLLREKPTVQWKKGWTPWGTPCSVLMIDGLAYAAQAAESQDCPLARMAEKDTHRSVAEP